MTSDEIFNKKISEKLNNNAEKVKSINAVYTFELTGDTTESWTIDLTKAGDFISQGAAATPNCTVSIKLEDLADIVEKKINP
ncbi:MAG TPA: SCP2 sterol-binding domain-containing protein, partial [bacterium]|nr:SCP2 sterol-binding domain-containing protein [bacterium]